MSDKKVKIGYLCIGLAAILFSSMECVLKMIVGDFGPIQLTWMRFLLGALFLLPFARRSLKKNGVRLAGSDWRQFFLLGLIGVVVCMTFYQSAVIYTEASVVASVFSSNPITVLLLSALILKSKLKWSHIVAMVMCIIGVVIMIGGQLQAGVSIRGIICALLANVFFSFYSVLGKKHSNVSGVVNTCYSFLAGTAELTLLILLGRIPAVAQVLHQWNLTMFAQVPFFSGITSQNILHLLYVSICVTGISYTCYFMASDYIDPNTASLTFYFKQVLGPLFAIVLLSEAIGPAKLLGMAVILAGSLIHLFEPYISRKLHLSSP